MPAHANVVFLPWVRQGAAAIIPVADTLGPAQKAVVELTAAIAITSVTPAETVPTPVRLRGPADVVGIDPREIVRMDPRPGSADFEPNYFPSIEFDRPDFPWLFTPAKATTAGRLRPWLCLIVVRVQEGVTLQSTADAPLPVLEIAAPANPADELPDLGESHFWAHAQAAGAADATPDELRALMSGNPALSLSRLLCPRILAPATDYLACVVPAFEVGRKAGLGLAVSESELMGPAGLAPAWTLAPPPAVVRLPVYHQWRFRTGEGGDFESLVRLLRPRPSPPGLGMQAIRIGEPGFELPASFPPDATIELSGALRPIDVLAPGWPSQTRQPFQNALAGIVNAAGTTEVGDPDADPLLAPPLYGRWHIGRSTVTPGLSVWLDELNLDPRLRAVAALGTRVVQEHQEALMAAAWEQAADLQPANQRLRQLQLGYVVSAAIHSRVFGSLSDDGALRLAAPAFARLHGAATGLKAAASTETLVKRLGATAVPVRAASAPMRRIGRGRGPISRRAMTRGVVRSSAYTWVGALNTGGSQFVSQPWFDLANVQAIIDHMPPPRVLRTYSNVTASLVANWIGRPGFVIVPDGQPVPMPPFVLVPKEQDSPTAAAFRAAAQVHLTRIDPARVPPPADPPPALPMASVRAAIQAELNPKRTFVALARAVVATGGNATPPANDAPDAVVPVDTVMAAPEFRQPMYAPLRDLAPDLLLPGLETVPPNTVLGLVTNRRFVEAYMVGLNVEMARELLWRGFPTDQRGTCFDQFWDNAGSVAPRPDVRPLHEWGTRPLGEAYATGERDRFVMLLRSDLLRRYPSAIVYLVKAVMIAGGSRRPSTNPADEVYPTFSGSMEPDVTFIGFDLTPAQVVGSRPYAGKVADPGYYIVIQEQPTEPRFGLDVGTPVSGTHLRVSGGPPPGLPANGYEWGRNAAHIAGIVRQQPVRIAIHAGQLVPAGTSSAIGGSLLTADHD